MQYTFFDYADHILFVRDDIESGSWSQEEMTLNALFPYHKDKEIKQEMRIGFVDALGVYQVFEIRKVRNYEPDHYQEITAESIVISELSNEFFYGEDVTDITPAVAVGKILTDTLWNIGNVTATNLSSADLQKGDVWSKVRTIENNWNVLITPRIIVGSGGITGRYLDIAPNEGTWRGLRLSLEKNADEVGVTIDDSEVYTALYGFGHSVDKTPSSATDEPPPLTFKDVVWTATAEHPAKPANQEYIEDPAATALYGRNGRARFGFYQNADITDANILLQKTWESLQQTNKPRISIDCLVRDLYRMGYNDQPIRLHDKAIVEIRPTGEVYTLDVIKLSVDLIDPTATRVTIGAYIPNIIYIQRDTGSKARGGGGGRGQTQAEYERQEFETLIAKNAYQITLKASQNDLNTLDGVVQESAVTIEAQGVTISSILNNVGDGTTVTAATIATAINDGASSVIISADHVDLQGYVTATDLATTGAYITSVTADEIEVAGGDVTIDTNGISCGNLEVNGTDLSGIGSTVSAVRISGPVNNVYTLQYQTYDDDTWQDAGNFNTAQSVTLDNPVWASGSSSNTNTFTVTASNGNSVSQSVYLWRDDSWDSGSRYVHLSHTNSTAANAVAKIEMTIPTINIPSAWGSYSSDPGADVTVSLNSAYTYHKATISCGGRTRTVRVKIL